MRLNRVVPTLLLVCLAACADNPTEPQLQEELAVSASRISDDIRENGDRSFNSHGRRINADGGRSGRVLTIQHSQSKLMVAEREDGAKFMILARRGQALQVYAVVDSLVYFHKGTAANVLARGRPEGGMLVLPKTPMIAAADSATAVYNCIEEMNDPEAGYFCEMSEEEFEDWLSMQEIPDTTQYAGAMMVLALDDCCGAEYQDVMVQTVGMATSAWNVAATCNVVSRSTRIGRAGCGLAIAVHAYVEINYWDAMGDLNLCATNYGTNRYTCSPIALLAACCTRRRRKGELI